MNRLVCFLCLAAIVATLGSNTGCSRQKYRMKADREVYSVIREGNNDSRWRIDDYRITPDPTSRMYDPFHPDREPMPLDDPTTHRKMHWIDGKNGSPHWYDNGVTQTTDNPRWRQSLMLNDRGEIPLDRDKAIELARQHSPEYQAALENLYRTAMAVSQQRYRYDVQFFGNGLLTYSTGARSATGARGNPTLRNNVTVGAEKALATGGTWVVDLANNVTWTFTGQGSTNAMTLINAGLTQPLLRGASRKVVLESLTQAERDFLVAVRQMVLFQQGHYARITTGSFSSPQSTSAPSAASGSTAGVPGVPSGGFYGLLSQQIQIQNRRQNIIGLEENLSRFLEMFEANQVDATQVAETQQNLLNAQSTLLGQINTYQGNIETYIRFLGLPPDLADEVNISDPLLEQFQLTSPELTVLMEDLADLLVMIRKKDEPLPENFRERTREVVRRTSGEMIVLGQDLDVLQRSMPERIRGLRDLEVALADRLANGERIDPSIYNTETFEKRVDKLRTRQIRLNLERLRAVFTILDVFVNTDEQELREMILNHSPQTPMFDQPVIDALETLNLNKKVETHDDAPQQLPERAATVRPLGTEQNTVIVKTPEEIEREREQEQRRLEIQKIIEELRRRDEYRDWIRRVFSAFQYELVTLSLNQTRTRLDSMTLVPVSVSAEEAFQTASEQSLDWMNRKSALVDTWRQIDIRADALKGVLGVELAGTTGTVGGNGVRFDRDNSEIQVRLRWDSPLNRYDEMMNYCRSQINYQNARRNYYLYVDSVHADLRNTIRNLQMGRINFEVNRNAVLIGTTRVDVMQLRMERPPQRGGTVDANAARDLISALTGLLDSQNSLLSTWVQYQTQRMLLDFGMGTMTLDDRGRWIDSGAMGSADISIPTLAPETAPLPFPILEAPRPNRRYVEE